MTDVELNNYILHYLEKDQTKSAIMLSAPWGTGKSFYIQNILIPFINQKGNFKVIVVSSYGLNEIDEISKCIYLESRVKIINSKNETFQTAKVVSKTIIKGIASFFGIDLSKNDEDLKKLYSSLSLKGTLIVIEDLERTNIDILSLLGYVNNLVEQDGAKVLLVANEQEIIKTEDSTDDEGKSIKTLTPESKEYLRVKEKTIGDTIHYFPNFLNALENILKQFKFEKLTHLENKTVSEIIFHQLIKENKSINLFNLRSIIFGVQKTIDILNFMNDDIEPEFIKTLLISNIMFSIKKKNNENLYWDKNHQGAQLGSAKFPLFKFAYDFIVNQIQDKEEANKTLNDFCSHNEFLNRKTKLNNDLEPLFSFYVESEENVKNAIDCLTNVLPNKSLIPAREYGRIGNYLIAVKRVIGYEEKILKCLDIMVNNLSDETVGTIDSIEIYSGIQLETKEDEEELKQFELRMKNQVESKKQIFLNFDYSLEKLNEFVDAIYKQKDTYVLKKSFANNLDTEKMIRLISECNSKEIYEIDGMFYCVYSFSNLNDYFKDDLEALNKLKEGLVSIKDDDSFDTIKKRRIRYFIEHLESIINSIDK